MTLTWTPRSRVGRGACYTEKKARREVSDFGSLGSRILCGGVGKKPDVVGLLAKGVNKARVRAVNASAELGSGRHCASAYESTAKLNR
jgi:hypothetical protein